MTDAKRNLACPVCSSELSLETLLAHRDERELMDALISAAMPFPTGFLVLRYLTLFAPAKNGLSSKRKVKLVMELMPAWRRQTIPLKGREWSAPPEHWEAAFDQMHRQQVAGEFSSLPLTNHGYLFAILAGMADKVEAGRERQVEKDRRAQGNSFGAAPSHPMTLDHLGAIAAQRDPALTKREGDIKAAAPVPAAVREFQQRIKGDVS